VIPAASPWEASVVDPLCTCKSVVLIVGPPGSSSPKLEHLQPFAPPRPNTAIILVGLDENQAWGAPNFQPAPQLDAQKSVFLAYFYK
jgi:hypothetical protein